MADPTTTTNRPTGTALASSGHATEGATAATKAGRKKPEGTKVVFFIKDAKEVEQLRKMADDEHRDTIDNMAQAIVRKHLKGINGHQQ